MRDARWLMSLGDVGLCDAAGGGEVLEREEASLMQQQYPVRDVSYPRELVSRDDHGARSRGRLVREWRSANVATQEQRIVDEEQLVGARIERMHLLGSRQQGREVGLDRSGVGPPQAGEAVQ